MRTLVFATNNKHKLEEVQAMTGESFRLLSLADIGCFDDIPETGTTFSANASQKTRYLVERFNRDCFADDSGLEIDALNGEPGVYSARYSGSRDMDRNIALVMDRMKGLSNRRARFKCVVSLVMDGQEHLFEGSIEGNITETLEGDGGFGYDPLFKPLGHELTFAQMPPQLKNSMSHRALAIEKLVGFLKQ